MTNHPSLQVSLLFALLLPACGGNSAAGTYVLDTDAMKKDALASAGAKPEERKDAEALVAGMIAQMKVELTLKADNTFTIDMDMGPMSGGKMTAAGTYRIEGDKLTMTTLEKSGVKKEQSEDRTATIKDGVITIAPGNGPGMTLKKR